MLGFGWVAAQKKLLNVNNMSIEKINMDDFLTIMNRLKDEVGIKNPTQLSKIINIPQATISRRKKTNQFEIEWAYLLSIQFDLSMEWILTGKKKKEKGSNLKREYLLEVERWINEIIKEDSRKADWFELELEKAFPDFKAWQQRKNTEENNNSSISKIA